jgi:hypothetical protein
VGRVARLVAAGAILSGLLGGCATLTDEEMAEKYPFRHKYAPRWDTNEVEYADASTVDKFGRNIRDGFIGIFNNFIQGLMSASQIGPWTGFIVQKGATVLGDVFGLLDANAVTEHVSNGVLSRQLLRFGSTAQHFPETMGAIHDTTFDSPNRTTLDYVGKEWFHTKVYGKPSGFSTLIMVVLADFIVRRHLPRRQEHLRDTRETRG